MLDFQFVLWEKNIEVSRQCTRTCIRKEVGHKQTVEHKQKLEIINKGVFNQFFKLANSTIKTHVYLFFYFNQNILILNNKGPIIIKFN